MLVSGTAVDAWNKKKHTKTINTQALILQRPSAVVLATVFWNGSVNTMGFAVPNLGPPKVLYFLYYMHMNRNRSAGVSQELPQKIPIQKPCIHIRSNSCNIARKKKTDWPPAAPAFYALSPAP